MPQGLFVHDKLKIVHRVYVSRCAYTQGYIANVNGVAALAVLGTTKNAERHKLHHLTLLRYCAYFKKLIAKKLKNHPPGNNTHRFGIEMKQRTLIQYWYCSP